jgi:glc operon protein GlcG
MLNHKSLSHTEAMTMIEAIRQKAEVENKGLAVAIVDAHGELIAFLRTDACRLPSIAIAQNKAYSAAREQIPSKELGQKSQDENFPMTNFGELRYLTWGGGLPIFYEGELIAAIGVSGLPEEEDIEFAKYGIGVLNFR